jgi:hypothetical protein
MSTRPGSEPRIAHLHRIETWASDVEDGARPRELFQVLWGLPALLQLGLPVALVRDASPDFLPSGYFNHVPAFVNQIDLLAAGDDLERKLDPELSQIRSCDPMPWGEAAFCFALAELRDAVEARWCPETLTSGSVACCMGVIKAREVLAFRVSDPAMAREFEAFVDEGRALLPFDPKRMPQRTPEKDPRALAERAAGWQRIVDWLRAADVAAHPSGADHERLLVALESWRRQCSALTPRRSGN